VIGDFRGKAVLVTGGTLGIGLATALAFGRRGAACTLTYKWGSADEDDVRRSFAEAGAPEPCLIQADAARAEDTGRVLAEMRTRHAHVEAFVSNVSQAVLVESPTDYAPRALLQSIQHSAWPFVDYTFQIREVFGRYPRYVVGISSTGVDQFSWGYDLMAASKAVMETLCRYLNYRLYDEDTKINVIRTRSVRTESFRTAFGSDFEAFARRFTREQHFVDAGEVADAAVALCSGLMDGVRGQVLTVDRGTSFFDNLMRLYNEREAWQL
jgi:NAD(P)-dependent dehydrogenase (short-subunit alcohol dehydrogenase family)